MFSEQIRSRVAEFVVFRLATEHGASEEQELNSVQRHQLVR